MINSKYKYFTRLELENFRCFGCKQYLDLSDGRDNPTRWNLILGENGLGKTTLLEFLAWMIPEPANDDAFLIKKIEDENGVTYVTLDPKTKEPVTEKVELQDRTTDPGIVILVPTLQNVDDNSFFERLPKAKNVDLKLRVELSHGRSLVDRTTESGNPPNTETEIIITGIHSSYIQEGHKEGELHELVREGSKEFPSKDEIDKHYSAPFVVVYGANRHMGKENKKNSNIEDPLTNRLIECELYDVEEILIDLDHRASRDEYNGRENNRFELFKSVLARVLPGIEASGIKVYPRASKESLAPSGVWFEMFSGTVRLDSLSLGYQTISALSLDLAWRLTQHYPESDSPLEEPAVVLIDELDLHLHPKWQLRIMDDLSSIFPHVQFIATSHSPLLVQAAFTTNFAVVLKRDDDVFIANEPVVVKSWRIDQILNSELFGLETSRDRDTERIIAEKYELLDKKTRTEEDEKRLAEINKDIASLPTISGSDQSALDIITRAAEILKKHGVVPNDTD